MEPQRPCWQFDGSMLDGWCVEAIHMLRNSSTSPPPEVGLQLNAIMGLKTRIFGIFGGAQFIVNLTLTGVDFPLYTRQLDGELQLPGADYLQHSCATPH